MLGADPAKAPRWAQRQRISFIGTRIRSGRAINRSDLMLKFGISAPQAATDFRVFKKHHPGAMRYDASRKAYVPHKITIEPEGRDTTAAADRLMRADDAELSLIVKSDPSMIRDVAAALIHARTS